MRQYQLTYLISADLNDEELKNISGKISNLFKEKGAILNAIKDPVKKWLGYSIKNKREAFLATIDFNIEPEKIKELKKGLDSEQGIIRYVILSKKPISLSKKPRIRIPIKETKLKTMVEKPREKKVELKEIEKKLEEILEE